MALGQAHFQRFLSPCGKGTLALLSVHLIVKFISSQVRWFDLINPFFRTPVRFVRAIFRIHLKVLESFEIARELKGPENSCKNSIDGDVVRNGLTHCDWDSGGTNVTGITMRQGLVNNSKIVLDCPNVVCFGIVEKVVEWRMNNWISSRQRMSLLLVGGMAKFWKLHQTFAPLCNVVRTCQSGKQVLISKWMQVPQLHPSPTTSRQQEEGILNEATQHTLVNTPPFF